MEKRVRIPEKELKSVYQGLKSRNLTLREISSEIGSDFRNYLYKGHSLDLETFDELQKLYSRDIEHEEILFVNGKRQIDDTEKLDKNEKTAELIGIMLGDGHLRTEPQNYLCITLHEDEEKMIEHTAQICQSVTGKKPKEYVLKDSRAVQLKIHSKEIVEKLIELRLEPGNKVENQMSIPRWIKTDIEFQERCLRGLIDTDGCIYVQNIDGRTIIRFKNRSFPLLKDFKELCRRLDIKPSNGGGKYSVQVASQPEVRKFIEKIEPIKAGQEYQTT